MALVLGTPCALRAMRRESRCKGAKEKWRYVGMEQGQFAWNVQSNIVDEAIHNKVKAPIVVIECYTNAHSGEGGCKDLEVW